MKDVFRPGHFKQYMQFSDQYFVVVCQFVFKNQSSIVDMAMAKNEHKKYPIMTENFALRRQELFLW